MLCYYTYAVFDRHLFTVMNFFTSEEGQINMSTKTQTTPFFYKQNVLAAKYKLICSNQLTGFYMRGKLAVKGLKLSTDSKALSKTRIWIEWKYATNFKFTSS